MAAFPHSAVNGGRIELVARDIEAQPKQLEIVGDAEATVAVSAPGSAPTAAAVRGLTTAPALRLRPALRRESH